YFTMRYHYTNFQQARNSFAERKLGRVPKSEHARIDQRETLLAFLDNKNQRAAQILSGWDVASLEQPSDIGETNREFRGVVSSGIALDAKIGFGHAARLAFGNTTRLDVHDQIFLVF